MTTKHALLAAISLLATAALLGCRIAGGLIAPNPTPSSVPAPTATTALGRQTPTSGHRSERRCGDGVCDGPENAELCPEDCADAPDATPSRAAEPTPTAEQTLPVTARPADEPGTYWVTNPTSGVELFTTIMYPDTWNGEPLPSLVIIPGGIDDSGAITERGLGLKATERGYAVVAFDADGRGRSRGEEGHSGFTQQDGLAAVIRFAASLPEVDADRLGMVSSSYGITLASGVLARYPELPIAFLIDWEGPADRYDTTLGCKPSPKYDWPPCEDEAAWAEHEALTFIADVAVPYQRIQSQRDHVQPDVSHAIHMVNAAVEGASSWVRLNDMPPDQTYDPEQPPEMLPESEPTSLHPLMLDYADQLFAMLEADGPTTGSTLTPVYVTVGTHVENQLPLPCGPAPSERCCSEYERFRANLITYADLFLDYGVAWNLQPNQELVRLAETCETDELRDATTGGKSIIPFLIEKKGVMVDPHCHPHEGDNYADVMETLRLHGAPKEMLTVVGGCYTAEPGQLETLETGWEGDADPDVVWRPSLLTFPALVGHPVDGEDYTSGMWKPTAFDYNPLAGQEGEGYYTHDPQRRIAMVGSGFVHSCALGHDEAFFYYASDYVEALVSHLRSGQAPADHLYTATIATNQQHVNDPDTYLQRVEAQLVALQDEVEAGEVIYTHYQHLATIWSERYDEEPNIYRLDEFERAEYTCDGEGNRVP